jgi:hypothetical protein
MGIYAVMTQTFKDKPPEITKIIDDFSSLMPDAFKALRDDFESKMKQKGVLP